MKNATSLLRDYQALRGDTGYYYVAHSSNLIVFVLPRARLRYDATGERQRQLRVSILKKATDALSMSDDDTIFSLLVEFCKSYA